MDRTDKECYNKVLTVTSSYVELIRKESNEDDSVRTIARYNNLAHTIASKIIRTNNTRFILICDKSKVEYSITMGLEKNIKSVRIQNFIMIYHENS